MCESVLFVENEPDLLELYGAAAELSNCESIKVRTFQDLEKAGDSALSCKVAVIDINLGCDSKSGIDACRWLLDHGFDGRVVFLTGHAKAHPEVAAATQLGNVSVLAKPISLDQLIHVMNGH